jgi:hypothetical protein
VEDQLALGQQMLSLLLLTWQLAPELQQVVPVATPFLVTLHCCETGQQAVMPPA